MGKQYATREDMQELKEAINVLAKATLCLAQWQAYFNMKDNPLQFNEEQRQEILEHSKGHLTHGLFKTLFRAYPLRPISFSPKNAQEK